MAFGLGTVVLRRAARRMAVALALTALLIGCSDTVHVDAATRDAAIYALVITDVADRSPGDLTGSEDLPVLFIEAFDADGIPLEVQVGVISEFTEQYEIRFIDDRDEAIATDLDGLPVRDDSLLIGLGPIVLDGTAEVRSEVYLSRDEVCAFRYTLAGGEDRWAVLGAPAEIEPEGFVSGS